MSVHHDPELLDRLVRRVDAATDGAPARDTVSTGFPTLDRALGGGARRGDLVALGGDTGAGKSALALGIALRAAAAGHGVAYFSGEMSPERIMERALAIEGRARIDDLRAGTLDEEERIGVGAAAHRLKERLPLVLPLAGDGAWLAGELRALLDVELAVVDSLATLPSGAAPQDEELAAAVRQLKRAAVEAGLAVLVTAPLAVEVRGRADQRPTLADFGALGAVRQHADVVLALFREEQYSPGFGTQGGAELHLLKNRNGPASGYVDLYFHGPWLRFEDMVDP